MFIFLALENMRIYLAGGMLLALIAIAAIALTNYLEDRRTLRLLRVRGAAAGPLFQFFRFDAARAGARRPSHRNYYRRRGGLRPHESDLESSRDQIGGASAADASRPLGRDGLDRRGTLRRDRRHSAFIQPVGVSPLGAGENAGVARRLRWQKTGFLPIAASTSK